MKDVDILFNCATPPPLSNNKQLFFTVNYQGTKTILAAAREAGIQVQLSSYLFQFCEHSYLLVLYPGYILEFWCPSLRELESTTGYTFIRVWDILLPLA